ncbi:MAG: P-II family nitrogen regulator [Desulfobaccales bacterium]
MKEIRAYIQPFMLSKVTSALQKIAGLPGLSVVEIQGFGRGKVRVPGDKVIREFVPKVRLEVVVKDELVEGVVQAIERSARTGNPGDGVIFVLPVEQAVRIRTGERDIAAIRSLKNEKKEEG